MRAVGVILAGGNNKLMRELSNKRAIAAMPIAGSYRSIDFCFVYVCMKRYYVQNISQPNNIQFRFSNYIITLLSLSAVGGWDLKFVACLPSTSIARLIKLRAWMERIVLS